MLLAYLNDSQRIKSMALHKTLSEQMAMNRHTPNQKTAADFRKIELAKIHIGKSQLQMEDDVYRAMLWQVAQVKSSTELDMQGRKKVLDHMVLMGATFQKSKTKRTTPAIDKARLASKVTALLADGKYPDTYGDSMAQRMFGVQRWEWLKPEQLRKLIAALSVNQRRLEKRP